jgi:hypothetical protein
LNSIVAGAVGAVNPRIYVAVRVSVGQTQAADGTPRPAYATPGSFVGSISGNTLTVASVAAGVLQPGQAIFDGSGAVLPGTTIVGLGSGGGGPGTYTVSEGQTVPSIAMSSSLTLLAQVQALSTRDLRQIEGLNLQGTLKAVYLNGALNGGVRVQLKGGDIVQFPDGSVWLVTLVPEPWALTAGWTKMICTLQAGS